MAELSFVDDDGQRVDLEPDEADELLALTGQLEAATVSACPECRSRVLAVVALADLMSAAPSQPRAREIFELADDAPTLHVYLVDDAVECDHKRWRDPGFEEWLGAISPAGPVSRRP